MAGKPERKLPPGAVGWAVDLARKKRKPVYRRPDRRLTSNERQKERRQPEFGIKIPGFSGRFFTKHEARERGYTVSDETANSYMRRIREDRLPPGSVVPPKFALVVHPVWAWSSDMKAAVEGRLPAGWQGHSYYYFEDRRSGNRRANKK